MTCGATEAMAATLLAIVNPGDEVIVMEPFYENYGPDAILCEAKPVFVPLEPGQPLDLDRLAHARSARRPGRSSSTRPNNPAGRVLTRAELEGSPRSASKHDAWAVTDEIYEHIRYTGEHIPMATLPGMADRTITISGASKTFSITGWRIGWIIAPPAVSDAIRKVHDFLTVGAPAPLQEAVAVALETLPASYYTGMSAEYQRRRDILVAALQSSGFKCIAPEGAYYILSDISDLSDLSDVEFAHWLTAEIGVASVPGSSFFSEPALGRHLVRFAFCKTDDMLRRGRRAACSRSVGPSVSRSEAGTC